MAGAVGGRASQPRAHKRTDALRTGAAGRVYFANTGPLHHLSALPLLCCAPVPYTLRYFPRTLPATFISQAY